MDIATPVAPVQPKNFELPIPGTPCDVWWSPADSAYVALDLEFEPFVHSDRRSGPDAIVGLEAAIRKRLAGTSHLSVSGIAA